MENLSGKMVLSGTIKIGEMVSLIIGRGTKTVVWWLWVSGMMKIARRFENSFANLDKVNSEYLRIRKMRRTKMMRKIKNSMKIGR